MRPTILFAASFTAPSAAAFPPSCRGEERELADPPPPDRRHCNEHR